jgi:D-3-phosphoglycerate dehydrogenase
MPRNRSNHDTTGVKAARPSMKKCVLISDKMEPEALAFFKAKDGFETDYREDISMEDLSGILKNYDALVIRSRTHLTAEMLENSGRLRIIGRAGAGTDNIDKDAATARGIIVMNTPGANTISTAEHSIAMLMALARHIPPAHSTMMDGKWAKKDYIGTELYEKTLGIIGMGKIGRVVCGRMKAFEMEILAHDPFMTQEMAKELGIELADVDTICEKADFITLHCPKNDETTGLINARRLQMMKKSAYLINCARGGIVDESALVEVLREKKIAGAAFDVYSTEPLPGDHPLRSMPNVVLTPHLAATTGEAQEKVSRDLAAQIAEALAGGIVRNAVNAPSVDARTYETLAPSLDLCFRLGKFLSQLCTPPVQTMEIKFSGTMCKHTTDLLSTRLLGGFLENHFSEMVNDVNAHYLANELGVHITESKSDTTESMYAGLVSVTSTNDAGQVVDIKGTINAMNEPRIVVMNDKNVDAKLEGPMLVLQNEDLPGIIGSVAMAVGNKNINIGSMTWGRVKHGGDAITILNVDEPIPPDLEEEIRNLPNIIRAKALMI